MELVKIGVTPQKTVLQFINELAERQSYEIQQLKRSAHAHADRRRKRAKVSRKSHAR